MSTELPLNEQARKLWLLQNSDSTAPPFWLRDIEDLRREERQIALTCNGETEPLEEVTDVEAGGVAARLYRPAGRERDVLVWMHGGGWMLGNLDSQDSLMRALANRSKAAVLSVDYRLAPEHPFPAAFEDGWTATQWASAHFDQVAIGGDSAGGNLAASVAIYARDHGLHLARQVLVYPALRYGPRSASYIEFQEKYRRYGTGDFGTNEITSIEHAWHQYIPDPASRYAAKAAPLRAPSHTGLPPAMIILAEHDVLRAEGEEYAKLLQDSGVEAQVLVYPGQLHGFFERLGMLDDAHDAVAKAAIAVRAAFDRQTAKRRPERHRAPQAQSCGTRS